jgi:hypothetical protein
LLLDRLRHGLSRVKASFPARLRLRRDGARGDCEKFHKVRINWIGLFLNFLKLEINAICSATIHF